MIKMVDVLHFPFFPALAEVSLMDVPDWDGT
jgi:hypothetical protein